MYKIPKYIPVVFHNLAGYDAHLFIRELAKYTTGMDVIAKNTEDYISFSMKVEFNRYIDKNGNECIKEMELRFIDSIKFMSKTSLPSIKRFDSNLNMSGVSDKDYEHACSLWREFGIRNMGEYHNLYLRTNVILLANVFESFRQLWAQSITFLHSSRIGVESLFKESWYKIRTTAGPRRVVNV